MNDPKLILIDGYWADDKTTFENYLIKTDSAVSQKDDDNIFFYGLTENQIKNAIKNKEEVNGEFFITAYRKVT